MKKMAAVVLAVTVFSLPAVVLAAGEQAPALQPKKGKVIAEVVVVDHAVVKAVDQQKRTVTLAMADGRERTFVVDKKVTKFDQVKVGDVVKASYREAISVKLKKTKTTPSTTVGEKLTRDTASIKPKGTASRTITMVATIDKIFDDGKMVTLRGPEGDTVDVKVRDPENLEKIKKGEVKVGDQVEITYTQAIAIAVEKAAQADKK